MKDVFDKVYCILNLDAEDRINNVTNTFELKDYYVETDDNINQNLPDDENNSKYTNLIEIEEI